MEQKSWRGCGGFANKLCTYSLLILLQLQLGLEAFQVAGVGQIRLCWGFAATEQVLVLLPVAGPSNRQ